MNTNEILQNALKSMSNEDKAKIFPPITRANFVVRESWLNRNQVITNISCVFLFVPESADASQRSLSDRIISQRSCQV